MTDFTGPYVQIWKCNSNSFISAYFLITLYSLFPETKEKLLEVSRAKSARMCIFNNKFLKDTQVYQQL
jgi:hypothetical protein